MGFENWFDKEYSNYGNSYKKRMMPKMTYMDLSL